MKGALRIAITIIVIIMSALIVLLTASYSYHRIHLTKEQEAFKPNGQIVDVDGDRMHVYTEGHGPETLVFMAGGGTSSPVYDFKSLYSLLSNQYRIAVVEKHGYGFSDITDSPRDIETMLMQTRKALSEAGVKGPYVLVPHSASGIEALYWAESFPLEVKAIVGLDIAVPAAYDDFKVNMGLYRFLTFLANAGVTRWIPNASESQAMQTGTLTDEEKEVSKVIFFRRTATKNMMNEVKQISSNAKKVKVSALPDIPMLLFVSNGKGLSWEPEIWRANQLEFLQSVKQGQLVELDVSHSVHNFEYEKIAAETKTFLEKIE